MTLIGQNPNVEEKKSIIWKFFGPIFSTCATFCSFGGQSITASDFNSEYFVMKNLNSSQKSSDKMLEIEVDERC